MNGRMFHSCHLHLLESNFQTRSGKREWMESFTGTASA